jgi:hypothetical protein
MGGMVGWESRGWKVLLPTVLLIGTFPCCHPCRDLHAQRRSGGASGRGLGSIQGLRLDLRHSTCVRIRGGRSKEAVIGDGPAMGECESGHAKPPSAGTGEGESSMGGNVMGDAPSAGQALPARDEFGSATQRPWGDCGPAIEMHQDEALRRFRVSLSPLSNTFYLLPFPILLESLSLSLSLSPSIHLSMCPSFHIHPSILPSVRPSIFVSVQLSDCLSDLRFVLSKLVPHRVPRLEAQFFWLAFRKKQSLALTCAPG